MGLKNYLYDIWEAVATTAKGMRITARYGVDPRETITLQYPEERWTPSDRYRGFLYNDVKKCTSCSMCVRVCPIDCISLESVRGADKKMVLVSYDINIARCMYCGLCVEVCPPKSLTHTSEYEHAFVDRGEFVFRFVQENPEDIKARIAKQVAEAAAKAEAEKAKAEAEKQKAEAEKAEAEKPKAEKPEKEKAEAEKGPKGADAPKDWEAATKPAVKDLPPFLQPAAPAYAAANPATEGSAEEKPVEKAEGKDGKPEEQPNEGGEKKE